MRSMVHLRMVELEGVDPPVSHILAAALVNMLGRVNLIDPSAGIHVHVTPFCQGCELLVGKRGLVHSPPALQGLDHKARRRRGVRLRPGGLAPPPPAPRPLGGGGLAGGGVGGRGAGGARAPGGGDAGGASSASWPLPRFFRYSRRDLRFHGSIIQAARSTASVTPRLRSAACTASLASGGEHSLFSHHVIGAVGRSRFGSPEYPAGYSARPGPRRWWRRPWPCRTERRPRRPIPPAPRCPGTPASGPRPPSMPISWYCVTSCSKSEDSPMMAVSDRMLAISVSISSLASVPACWAVARSRSFTLLMVLASSSFSMLNRSNTASAAPAARPPQNAWELLPPLLQHVHGLLAGRAGAHQVRCPRSQQRHLGGAVSDGHAGVVEEGRHVLAEQLPVCVIRDLLGHRVPYPGYKIADDGRVRVCRV